MVSAGLVFAAVVGLTYAGVIAPWSGRFYSLYDTGLGRERVGGIVRGWQYHQVYVAPLNSLSPSLSRYAKIHIPIIASVSEHQPTTWTSFFFDLHVLVCLFPSGVWFVMRHLNDVRVFG